MEVLEMSISEKEARESDDTEKKNIKIDRVLENIQQYLED